MEQKNQKTMDNLANLEIFFLSDYKAMAGHENLFAIRNRMTASNSYALGMCLLIPAIIVTPWQTISLVLSHHL